MSYCELEPAEALVVGAGEADHLRADRALRVRALLLRVGVDPGEVLREELVGALRVGEALDVEEVRLLAQQLRIERVRVDAEQLVRRDARSRAAASRGAGRRRSSSSARRSRARRRRGRRSTRGRRGSSSSPRASAAPPCRASPACTPCSHAARPSATAKTTTKNGEQQPDAPVGGLLARHFFARLM